jgi:hypothetical protein
VVLILRMRRKSPMASSDPGEYEHNPKITKVVIKTLLKRHRPPCLKTTPATEDKCQTPQPT